MNKKRIHNSISFQVALVIIGFTIASLVLNIYLYRRNMRVIAINEVESKATIFLSAMESNVRRFLMERDNKSITESIAEGTRQLEKSLNFSIMRVALYDIDGKILDHTNPAKIGDTHFSDELKEVYATKETHIKQLYKTLKAEPGQPDVNVIEVTFPVVNRKQGEVLAAIKIIVDVQRTFDQIEGEYRSYSQRIVLGLALISIFLILGTLFFLRRKIISPVLSVVSGAEKVAQGDLGVKLTPSGSYEISRLMQSFNQMVDGLKQREDMRQSLEIAKEVQQNLLPQTTPQFKGLDIAGKSIYCDETGGDYFDYFVSSEEGSEQITIVVGDVTGHGIPSALLMASARAFLRQRFALPGALSVKISDVNRQLTRDVGESCNFMTLFCMTLDRDGKSLKWVRAGHDPAILFDIKTNGFSELKGPGILLGLEEDWSFEDNQISFFEQDQIIVLGTDGIWETNNGKKMFGKEPIYRIVKENSEASSQQILEKIVEELSLFHGGMSFEDDVTLVVLKTEAQP